MENYQDQSPAFSAPEYSSDDVKKRIAELAKPKIDHFNRWFRTEFIIYLITVSCLFIYSSPYLLHFMMRDYSLTYWSQITYSFSPLWIIVSSVLCLLAAPYNIFKLKPSYKDVEFQLRKEKCLNQYMNGSLFVKKQINDYCLSVYKSKK